MKKGFTLIELLAVIVILAVLALIATPIVLNIIDDSKKNATLRSSENYIKAIEFSIAKSVMENKRLSDGEYPIMSNGSICIGTLSGNTCSETLVVEVSGETSESGNVTIKSRKIDSYEFTYASGFVVINGEINGGEIPEPKSFSEDSWDTIAANVRAGNLSKYKVGDTKTITLTGEVSGTYTVRVANTSTPSECSGSDFSQTACGFVIEFADTITNDVMNAYTDGFDISTNEGGWENSDMRSYVNSTILNSFPEDLKDLIIDTKVVSGYSEYWDSSNFVTTDKLYLLATGEIWENGEDNIIEYDAARDLTRQLDYYNGVTTDDYEKAIKGDRLWWLRSAYSNNTNSFYSVNDIGGWNYTDANVAHGVAVAFRL